MFYFSVLFYKMKWRKIKADKIFDGEKFLYKKILKISLDGEIREICDEQEQDEEVEYFEGIITPGFVNCHCHLELSHLKGAIEKKTGLVAFVQLVMKNRFFDKNKILNAANYYDSLMKQNGIVAVGDICNTVDTITIKQKSAIQYYNFVEVAGFIPATAQKRMDDAMHVATEFLENGLMASVVPHAPYSVSEELFNKINVFSSGKIISIHNQESKEENLFFKKKEGDFIELYKALKTDISFFKKSTISSLQRFLPLLHSAKKILLVHNTFTTEEDILFAEDFCDKNNIALFWVFCPNANLYIEDNLPLIDIFFKNKCNICLGTDSLSSNEELDISSEMRTIKKYFPTLSEEALLKAASLQGAAALGLNHLGMIRKDMKPGINLIDKDFNFIQKII